MSFPLTYRDAMIQLAQLTEPGQPASIRHQALSAIIRELSPANPRHQDILRALEPAPRERLPEASLSPEQQKDFHLHPIPADLALPATGEADSADDADDSAEEEDDPF